MGGFLVRTGSHTVLIDTGVGPDQIGPYGPYDRVIKGGELPTRLAELGVESADVTDIVLTHLHPDHYGWATHDAARLFPKATFRCHALDWDHFVVQPGPQLAWLVGTAALPGRPPRVLRPRRPAPAWDRCSPRTRAHAR